MKVRQGFVSNSSSSSFIVSEEDVKFLFSKGIDVYKIKDIYQEFERITSIWFDMKIPGFMLGTYFNPDGYKERIEKLYEERPNDYITEEVDRDWALENNFDFGIFEYL